MPSCFVRGCTSSSNKKEKIGLHTFPKHRELAKLWLEYCNIPVKDISWRVEEIIADYKSDKYRMCSRHFSDDQFEMTSKQGKLFKHGRLMRGATPNVPCPGTSGTLNLPHLQSEVTRTHTESQTYSCCMCMCHAATQTVIEKADTSSQTCQEDKDTSGSRDAFSQWPEHEFNVSGDVNKVQKDHTYPTTFIPPSPPPCTAPLFESTPIRKSVRRHVQQFDPILCENDEIQNIHEISLQTEEVTMQIDESVEEVVVAQDEHADADPDFMEYSRPADDSWVEGTISDLEEMVFQKKYLVFINQLLELFDMMACKHVIGEDKVCGRALVNLEIGETGSCVTVRARCFENHPPFEWSSQPMVGKMRAGNLLLCSGILFSGLTFEKASKFAGFVGMGFVGSSTFYSNQKLYLYPAIHDAWCHQQMELEIELASSPIAIAGDGQCDSPGYSAKYCVYTVMEHNTRKILSIVVVQVTECTSSTAMEKLALQKALAELEQRGFTVEMLVTDRHISIAKMMREQFKKIKHQYDLWHFGKSIKKKVVEASKKKNCKDLGGWLQSINNHLWWCSRTCNKSLCLLMEKWNSILLHTTNKHMWLGYEVFHQCEHETISVDAARKKKWLTPGTPAHDALVKIVCDKTIKKDLQGLTHFQHTGPLEVFHSNVLTVRPKLKHFSIDGMLSRTRFVALLHNCNTGRKQARVKVDSDKDPMTGPLRFKMECPKSRKDWIAKKLFEGYDYGIVFDLMVHVLQIKKMGLHTSWESRAGQMPENIAPVPKPLKSEVVSKMTTRF